ncbi:TPA: LysR family transcriptional regulator [Klebsiella quasipneumoniae subsp. similipneumoniae]|nr:LysR family transcriptional regulator [Klebsiella quasipneumoniae subsp. similipneumoniae]
MDLKILRYFLTVSNTNNITKAADLLHITQPTLSRQLIMLEQSLGKVRISRSFLPKLTR